MLRNRLKIDYKAYGRATMTKFASAYPQYFELKKLKNDNEIRLLY